MVKSSIVRQLLPVIDNFERSLKHIPKDLQANEYVKGVQGVVKQFEDTRKMMRMMGDKNQMAKLMKNMPGGMPKM